MPDDSSQIESTRSRLRQAMPVAKNWAYFDHAAVAPISGPAAEVLRNWLSEAVEEGDTKWLDWARQLSDTREASAQLIGADLNDIALVPNTTAGDQSGRRGIGLAGG